MMMMAQRGSWPMTTTTTTTLTGFDLTDKGLKSITTSCFRTLESLGLEYCCAITDDGLYAISKDCKVGLCFLIHHHAI